MNTVQKEWNMFKRTLMLCLSVVLIAAAMFPSAVYADTVSTPGKVSISSVEATASNKVVINWKQVSNATEYRIYYRQGNTTKWKKIAKVDSSKASYTHISSTKYPLTAGKKYYYTVRAYNKNSQKLGSYDKTGKAVTMLVPNKVKLVSATVTAADKVTIKWQAAMNATSYRIYYKEKGTSKWIKIMNVGSDVFSYTHFNSAARPLTPGKTYIYTVRAYNMSVKKWGGYDKTGKTVTIPQNK